MSRNITESEREQTFVDVGRVCFLSDLLSLLLLTVSRCCGFGGLLCSLRALSGGFGGSLGGGGSGCLSGSRRGFGSHLTTKSGF